MMIMETSTSTIRHMTFIHTDGLEHLLSGNKLCNVTDDEVIKQLAKQLLELKAKHASEAFREYHTLYLARKRIEKLEDENHG